MNNSPNFTVNPDYETQEFEEKFNEIVLDAKNLSLASQKMNLNFKGLAKDLYSEVGHYIFELLQNADDTHATQVKFIIKPDSLEFMHNGSKLFTPENIRAICSFGASDGKDDYESIGRFGVGFKSTSRISELPQVRCCQFAFQIHHQLIPEKIDTQNFTASTHFDTAFRFPFGTSELNTQQIHTESIRALDNLDSQYLLFLNHINVVVIEIEGKIIRRKVLGKSNLTPTLIELKQSLNGTKDSVNCNYFLKYSKEIDSGKLTAWAEKNNYSISEKSKKIKISIALNCKVESLEDKYKIIQLKALDPGKLFVYFPTKNESTGLKFHIHAPFSATTTRENIHDSNTINNFLFSEFPELLQQALTDLVSNQILNTEGLEVFPNSGDTLRAEIKSVQSEIYKFFDSNERRVPLEDGQYGTLRDIHEVSNEIAGLLSNSDLHFIDSFNLSLSDKHVYIQKPKNIRSARFLSSIGIPIFGIKELVLTFSHINSAFATKKSDFEFKEWIGKYDLVWFCKFYALLSGFEHTRLAVYFSKIPIIRVNSESHSFVTPGEAYFSRTGEKTGPNFVHPLILDFSMGKLISSSDALVWRVLEALGVRQFSKSMELQDRIDEYFSSVNTHEDLEEDDLKPNNMQALAKLLNFVHNDVELERAILKEKIFLSENPSGLLTYRSAQNLYIDSPYKPSTGLDSVMSRLKDFQKRHKIWKGYSSIPNIVNMLERLGVMTSVMAKSPGSGPVGEWEIEGLDQYLLHGDDLLRKNVWNYIKSPNANRERHYLKFPNSYSGNSKEPSRLALILRNTAWIPDLKGVLRKPSELDEKSISKEFLIEKCDFLEAIHFGFDTAAAEAERQKRLQEKQQKLEAAKILGIHEIADFEKFADAIRKDPKKFERLIEEINKPVFGDHAVDPLSTMEETRKATEQSPDVENEEVSTSQRKEMEKLVEERKAYLRKTYEINKIISCQICNTSSFIKLTNKETYFEAIMVIPSFHKNSKFNSIAVCGQCSAKYKYSRKNKDSELKSRILGTNNFSGIVKIQIEIANEVQYINFKETHFSKLKGALSAE